MAASAGGGYRRPRMIPMAVPLFGVRAPLIALEAVDPSRTLDCGGKAVGLAELIRRGWPVPAGVVVPAAVFRAAWAAGDRAGELDRLCVAALAPTPAGEAAGEELRARVGAFPLCPTLAAALEEVAPRLGESLALRSSAACEDLPEASFAGQHASFLGLKGAGAVLARIPAAWASFFSARALAYRRRMGFGPEEIGPALVVQAMVDARAAGVLFSRDPRGGPRRLVTAAWGLGEGVVSGRVEPDTWALDPGSGAVLEFRAGAKAARVVVRPDASGTRDEDVPAAARAEPCLTPGELEEVARLAGALERDLGGPKDVEFACGPGGLALLQVRAATGGPGTVPAPSVRLAPTHVYVSANVAETMGAPTTAMGASSIQWILDEVLASGLRANLPPGMVSLAWIEGRPFFDATALFVAPWLGRRVVRRLVGLDVRTARTLHRLLDGQGLRASWPLGIGGTVRVAVGLGWSALRALPGLWRAWRDPPRARAALVAEVERGVEELRAVRRRGGEPAVRLLAMREAFERVFGRITPGAQALMLTLVLRLASLQAELAGLVEGSRVAGLTVDLATPPGGNRTEAMARVVAELARRAGALPAARAAIEGRTPEAAWEALAGDPAAADLVAALAEFLREFGHRGPGEQDLGAPRFADVPASLIPFLAAQLDDPGAGAGAGARVDAARAARTARRAELLRELEARFPGWWGRRRIDRLRARIDSVQEVFALREDLKHHFLRLAYEVRAELVEVGRELVRRRTLERADDVFELSRDELYGWVGAGCPEPDAVRRKVRRRRADRARLAARAVPLVVLESGEDPEASGRAAAVRPAARLHGEPASPGVVEGSVRILADPSEGARLGPGDVLVAIATDPGWTPLFPVAGALVMEVGGVVSHGAIVAREFGLPAVLGLADATRVLRDGERVRVDGSRGTVERLDHAGDPGPGKRDGSRSGPGP